MLTHGSSQSALKILKMYEIVIKAKKAGFCYLFASKADNYAAKNNKKKHLFLCRLYDKKYYQLTIKLI